MPAPTIASVTSTTRSGPGGRDGHPQDIGVDVEAVGDELDAHPGVGEQQGTGPGLR